MKKIKSKAGHIVYELKAEELLIIRSPGICDFCGRESNSGFLIVVINEWVCPKCYRDWEKTATYYPEDAHIEKRNEQLYDRIFGGGINR